MDGKQDAIETCNRQGKIAWVTAQFAMAFTGAMPKEACVFNHEEQKAIFGDPIGGGWLCLDFSNTADWRIREVPEELLTDYWQLVSWSHYLGVLTQVEAAQLLQEAEHRPAEAAATLAAAIELREAIYRIFSAISADGSPSPEDLVILNRALAGALSHLRIEQTREGFAWTWADAGTALDRMLWPVARSAADLLTLEHLDRVGVCANEGCGWLFFDTSRNRSRRWCSMQGCGNRAKARRYYARHAAADT